MKRVEKIKALYQAILDGNPLAADRLIELCAGLPNEAGKYRGLVAERVALFLRKNSDRRRLRDDLISAGNLRLVQAVRKLTKPHNQKRAPQAFLVRGIDSAIWHECDNGPAIGPGARTCRDRRAAKKRGEGRPPEAEALNFLLPLICQAGDDAAANMLTEIVDDCCGTVAVAEIVRRTAAGELEREVAASMGIDQPAVARILARVRARYEQQTLALGA